MLLINLFKHYLIKLYRKTIGFIFSTNFFPKCMSIYIKTYDIFETLISYSTKLSTFINFLPP